LSAFVSWNRPGVHITPLKFRSDRQNNKVDFFLELWTFHESFNSIAYNRPKNIWTDTDKRYWINNQYYLDHIDIPRYMLMVSTYMFSINTRKHIYKARCIQLCCAIFMNDLMCGPVLVKILLPSLFQEARMILWHPIKAVHASKINFKRTSVCDCAF
jgi:hypothetical protein